MPIISSRQNPLVRAFRDLARHPDPTGARLLLDGVHLVRDAHAAGMEFESIAIAASRSGAGTEEEAVAHALQTAGVRIVTVNEQVFAAMSPVRAPSGIVAIARRSPVAPKDICATRHTLVLVAADVQDPGNLGSLIRAGEAGGADG